MIPLQKLPRFKPVPAVDVTDYGDISVITLRPTAYGMVSGLLRITANRGLYDILETEGFTLFGSRDGHLSVAEPGKESKAGRLHPLLTTASPSYQCLYRDGDAANLTFANLGFRIPGGKEWWMVPLEGENDPAYSVEGLTYRYPKAITSRREVVKGEAPPHTPTMHRMTPYDVSLREELEELQRRRRLLH